MKNLLLKLIPWGLLAVFIIEIVAILIPKKDGVFHVREFGRLPALLNGRVQPMDSVGRNALLQIRGTASVPLEEKKSYEFWKHPRKLRAAEWLLEVMASPDLADTRPVFLIHHPDLINELNLRGKGVEKSGLFYYTFNELTNCLPTIEKEGQQVMAVEPAVRTAYQKQVAKLQNALSLYRRLKNSLQPETWTHFSREFEKFTNSIPAGLAALRAREANQSFDQAAFNEYLGQLSQFDFMARMAYPLLVPPADPVADRNGWRNTGQVLLEAGVGRGSLPPAITHLGSMAAAWRTQDAVSFNKAVADYQGWLRAQMPAEASKGRLEFFYNNLQAFLHAMIIYLFAFVLAAGAMLTLSVLPGLAESLRRASVYLIILALVVHTAGLVFRMYLERRPPVTNLYSSAIFIGWMAVLLGVVLERAFRVGIGAAAAALVGAITLIIAHNLALGGDTMEMMRAVLDSNFWLATHVVTITLGYAANFLAGLLGLIYIVLGLLTPMLRMKLGELPAKHAGAIEGALEEPGMDIGKALDKMVYAIICFATLFSFVGTVLGGIWADQSWGRFWGWDPKENGALIIVLWNAMMLHVRWDGMAGPRGFMNLAIFGNVVTAFSWFGVNMLGIGLHSYGFMDAAFKYLVAFIASQVLFIGLGCLPLRWWRSHREAAARPQPAP